MVGRLDGPYIYAARPTNHTDLDWLVRRNENKQTNQPSNHLYNNPSRPEEPLCGGRFDHRAALFKSRMSVSAACLCWLGDRVT